MDPWQATNINAGRTNSHQRAIPVAVNGQLHGRHWGISWPPTHQLEIIMTCWRAIEELAELPGPFIYAATRTRLRKLDLDLA